jgi:hypothetical protein
MVMAFSVICREADMKVIGRRTSSMGLARRYGTGAMKFIRENFTRERRMGEDCSNGQMGHTTMAILWMVSSMEMVLITSRRVQRLTRDNSRMEKSRELDICAGKMVEIMRENLLMEKRRVKEHLPLPMVTNTLANSKMAR